VVIFDNYIVVIVVGIVDKCIVRFTNAYIKLLILNIANCV